jgi:hypothetical protein
LAEARPTLPQLSPPRNALSLNGRPNCTIDGQLIDLLRFTRAPEVFYLSLQLSDPPAPLIDA